jgi:two-component system sensor histidine kinase ChiS
MTERRRVRTILVVDDEPEVLDLVSLLLEWDDYAVVQARNGHEALEQARATRPDLMLLDVRMPKLDGLDVLELLQADPALQSIPVVMLSVMTYSSQVKTALEAGAVAYLPKPFELGEIIRLVEQITSADAVELESIRQHSFRRLSATL